MTEASSPSKVEVGRAWRYDGEEGMVHFELLGGGETLTIDLKAGRNPRMFQFIMKHATITTEPRPPQEPITPQ